MIVAAPNIERTGVIAGFVLTVGAGLYPAITKGVLFAQGTMYRPGSAPSLPAVAASAQRWLFYNSISGFYWASSFTPGTAGDAFLGWVVSDSTSVVLCSTQYIGAGEATGVGQSAPPEPMPAPIPTPEAPNQTPITSGDNACRVNYVARGVQTLWQFLAGVTFHTSAPEYTNLVALEIVAKLTSGTNPDRSLGWTTLPAAGGGDVDTLWNTDEWPLPVNGDDTWTLEFRSYNADGNYTANPPQVTGLVVHQSSQVATGGAPLITGWDAVAFGYQATQEGYTFNCSFTVPADVSNLTAFKIFLVNSDYPAGKELASSPVFASMAGISGWVGVSVARADCPASGTENWDIRCVSVDASGEANSLSTAPSVTKTVPAPSGIVPDLIAPLVPTSVVGSSLGLTQMGRFGGYNESLTKLRVRVTLPALNRATFCTVWLSKDNGATWEVIHPALANGDPVNVSVIDYDYWERTPAATETDWVFKVQTRNAQVTNPDSSAVASAAFTIGGIGTPGTTGASAATVGPVRYSRDADGVWRWGVEYIKWTPPSTDPNYAVSVVTIQLVDASGTPDPSGEAGIERLLDSTTLIGAEYTSYPDFAWPIPEASATYRYFRFRIRVVNYIGARYIYTGCWPAGADYYDVVPTEQTGALQVQRADASRLGPELSVGVHIAGGTPTLRLSNTVPTNLAPNSDFQLAHPTTASWVDKWTKSGTVTRESGGESGDYCLKLANGGSITGEKIRVAPGQQFNFTARVKADSGVNGYIYLTINVYESDSTFITSHYPGYLPGTTWETLGYTYTIPAASGGNIPYYIAACLFVANESGGKFYYADRVQLSPVTVQQDQISAGVSTAVTLGQHMNASSQFAGVGVQRSTGWRSEVRDNHVTVYGPSGRALVEIYGADAAPDFGYVIVKADDASGKPQAYMGAGGGAAGISAVGSGTNGIITMYCAASPDEGQLLVNGNKVIGARGAAVADASASGFVDRGDPSAVDKTKTTLTIDSAWHDWDMSAIVPAGATAVLIRAMIDSSNTSGTLLALRKNGNSNTVNAARCHAGSVAIPSYEDLVVACDANRVIEYYVINAGTYNTVDLTIAGWWISGTEKDQLNSWLARARAHGLIAT